MRTLAMISKRLLGIEVSKTSISSSLDLPAGEAERWLTRPINKGYWALYVDGTNFKVQRRGSTQKEPSLVVLGVDENNLRYTGPGGMCSSICERQHSLVDLCDSSPFRYLTPLPPLNGCFQSHEIIKIFDFPTVEQPYAETYICGLQGP